MKFIKINKTTLSDLDDQNEIRIEICHGNQVEAVDYVSFAKLEKWVASIREQIITVATDAEPCFVCGEVGSHDRNCPTFYGDT